MFIRKPIMTNKVTTVSLNNCFVQKEIMEKLLTHPTVEELLTVEWDRESECRAR